MKKKTKTLLAALCLSTTFLLGACGGSDSPNTNNNQTSTAEPESITTSEVITYTVKFETGGGTAIDNVVLDEKGTIQEPKAPEREGYRFVGWSLTQNGGEKVTFPLKISKDTTLYAIWNEKIDMKGYLKELLSGYKTNIMSYIPDSMEPNYESNLIASPESMTFDYSQPVNVNSIQYQGYGEQWNMIINNLQDIAKLLKVLDTIEVVSDASVAAFNNYLDKNTEDTANYTTKVMDYDVTIKYENKVMEYALSFSNKDNQAIEIWLKLNLDTKEKTGRIQVGDANAIKYIETPNSYECALRLAGVKRSYLKLVKDKDTISGQINEHTGIDGKLDLKSAAQFFADKNKVVAVGNKADAMIKSNPVVVEVYNIKNGRLLGFEVQEHVGEKLVYNTLWFNLNDTTGISKFCNFPVTDSKGHVSHEIRINDQDKEFKVELMGITHGAKAASRRYLLELRDRYYTHKEVDEDKEKFVTKGYKVPMLSVQEEVLDSVVKDINKNNKGINFNLLVAPSTIATIKDEYSKRIEPFNEVKEAVTQESILEFIGASFTK